MASLALWRIRVGVFKRLRILPTVVDTGLDVDPPIQLNWVIPWLPNITREKAMCGVSS